MPGMLDHEDDDGFDVRLVRPFTLTRGRTRNETMSVAIEALVAQVQPSPNPLEALGPVEQALWREAVTQQSVAELSVCLDLPLGVIRVLVGDLVTSGHLQLGRTATLNDVNMVKRLIDGIRLL